MRANSTPKLTKDVKNILKKLENNDNLMTLKEIESVYKQLEKRNYPQLQIKQKPKSPLGLEIKCLHYDSASCPFRLQFREEQPDKLQQSNNNQTQQKYYRYNKKFSHYKHQHEKLIKGGSNISFQLKQSYQKLQKQQKCITKYLLKYPECTPIQVQENVLDWPVLSQNLSNKKDKVKLKKKLDNFVQKLKKDIKNNTIQEDSMKNNNQPTITNQNPQTKQEDITEEIQFCNINLQESSTFKLNNDQHYDNEEIIKFSNPNQGEKIFLQEVDILFIDTNVINNNNNYKLY